MSDTDTDAGPTPGKWYIDREDPRLRPYKVYYRPGEHSYIPIFTANQEVPDGDVRENLALAAAAGTAAHELPDEYDPVGAVEVLPTSYDSMWAALSELMEVYTKGVAEEVSLEDAEHIERAINELDHALQKARRDDASQ